MSDSEAASIDEPNPELGNGKSEFIPWLPSQAVGDAAANFAGAYSMMGPRDQGVLRKTILNILGQSASEPSNSKTGKKKENKQANPDGPKGPKEKTEKTKSVEASESYKRLKEHQATTKQWRRESGNPTGNLPDEMYEMQKHLIQEFNEEKQRISANFPPEPCA